MDRHDEAKKIKEEIERLQDRLEDIREDSGEMAREKAREYARMAQERAQKAWVRTKELGRNIDGYAKENPWIMMAIGVGVGLTMGMLAGYKRRCR